MKHFTITILACLLFGWSYGQNLVLNPGFESGSFPGAFSQVVGGACNNWEKGCEPSKYATVHQPPYVFPVSSFAGAKYTAVASGEIGQQLRGEFTQALPKGNYIFDMDYIGIDWPNQGHQPGAVHVYLVNSTAECDGSEQPIVSIDFINDNNWLHSTVCFNVENGNYYDRIEFAVTLNSSGTPGQVVAVVGLDEVSVRSADLISEDFDGSGSGYTSDLTAACNCNFGTYCVVNTGTQHCSSLVPIVGSGNFMSIINPNDGVTVWRSAQTVNVIAGGTYEFSMGVNDYGTPNGPNLEVQLVNANGKEVIDVYNQAGSNAPNFEQFSTLWIAPNTGIYTLEIVQLDKNEEQDYAIDDILFQERGCCSAEMPENLECQFSSAGIFSSFIFSWAIVPNATYEVQLLHDDGCCFPKVEDPTIITTTTLPTDDPELAYPVAFGIENKCIAWRVRAICPDGSTSEWSERKCICHPLVSGPPTGGGGGGKQALQEFIHRGGALTVFPNPSQDRFHFRVEATTPVHSISVMDLNGRVVTELSGDAMSSWEPAETVQNGTYIAVVHLQNGELLFTKISLVR